MTADTVTQANIALWDGVFATRSWGRYPPEELVRFMSRTYPVDTRRKIRVLEVGCGSGANVWFLAREGFCVSGIDGSEHAVAALRRRLAEEGLGDVAQSAEFRVGNFASLPWDADTFDCVVDIEAISANRSAVIESTVTEIFRVLKPGGMFFGKMFGVETTGVGSGELLEPGTSGNPTEGPLTGIGVIHAFAQEELGELFGKFSGLTIDWTRRSDQGGKVQFFEWLVQARK